MTDQTTNPGNEEEIVAGDEAKNDAAPDFLNMSDEDMRNFDPSTLASAPADEVKADANTEAAKEATTKVEGADDEDNAQDDVGGSAKAAAGGSEEDAAGKAATDATGATKVDPAKEGKTDEVKADAAKAAEGAKDPAKAEEVPDYKALYEKITGTFKANGRDIQVKNPEDAIALMQMGANYNKKMAALKPNLRLMKMLEQADLLNEEKLTFLIDLDKKNPEAINKLVKDSKIDPLDLTAEKAEAYKPGNHKVDDSTVHLDEVMNELDGSEHFGRTLEVVAKQWDQVSKNKVLETPEIMKVINQHMEMGVYDLISKKVEDERVYGRLKGLSDLEAYRQVGDAMYAQGELAEVLAKAAAPAVKPAEKVIVQPKPKQDEEDKLRDKKRAASSPKSVVPGSAKAKGFDPLAMSDEDFAKQAKQYF